MYVADLAEVQQGGCNNVRDDLKTVAHKDPFDMLPMFTCTLQMLPEVQQGACNNRSW
jgi:hypothetical protein